MMLFLALVAAAFACSSSVDLTNSGLFVDSLSSAGGDGSECNPLTSLDDAITTTNASGGGKIVLVSCPWEAQFSLSVTASLILSANNCKLKVSANIQVSAPLTLTYASIVPDLTASPTFLVQARTKLTSCQITGFSTVVFTVSSALEVESCQFSDNSATIIRSTSEQVEIIVKDSSIARSGNFLSWESFILNNSPSSIQVLRSTFTQVTKTLLSLTQNSPSSTPSSFLIQQCTFTNVQLIASVKALALSTSVLDSTITASRLIELYQVSSVTLIKGCSISSTVGNNILVSYLDGQFSLQSTIVSGVTNGSFLFIANSKGVLTKALVSITDLQVTKLLGRLPENYVVRLDSVIATIKNVKLTSIDTTSYGAISLTASVVAIDNYYIEDARGQNVSCLFMLICSVTMKNSTFKKSRTFITPVVAYGGIAHISDSSFSDTDSLLTLPGYETFHLAFSGTSQGSVINCKFFDFYSSQNGFLSLTYCSNTLVQGCKVTNLKGQTGLREFNSINTTMKDCDFTLAGVKIVGSLSKSLQFKMLNCKFVGAASKSLIAAYETSDTIISGLSLLNNFSAAYILQTSSVSLTLAEVTIEAANVLQLFSASNDSNLLLNSLKVTNMKGTIGFFGYSTATFQSVQFLGMTSQTDLLVLQKTTLTITDCKFIDIKANEEAITATDSKVIMKRTQFIGMTSYSENLIGMVSSEFTVSDSSFTNVESNLFLASKSTLVLINCDFINLRAGTTTNFENAIHVSASTVKLEATHVTRVEGTDGAFLNALGSQVFLDSSHLAECSGKEGGCLKLVDSNATISTSSFRGSRGNLGGAMLYTCSTAKCNIEILQSEFTNCTASAGGVLYWTGSEPTVHNTLLANNSAIYGNNFATSAARLGLLGEDLQETAVYPDYQVSGQQLSKPILIGVFDIYDQLVIIDSSSIAKLKSSNESRIAGTDSAYSVKGIYNFTFLELIAAPPATLLVTISSSLDVPDLNFTVYLRECEIGEVLIQDTCVKCQPGFYSVNPDDEECRRCIDSVECLGGSSLMLNDGYWRVNLLSDDVYECPIADSCIGGLEESCETGYDGRLCSQCKSDWYRIGRYLCDRCPSATYSFVKALLMSGFMIFLYTLYCRRLNSSHPKPIELVLKLFLNSMQLLCIFIMFSIEWRVHMQPVVQFLDTIATISLSQVASICIYQEFEYKAVYIAGVVFSLSPFIFLVVSTFINTFFSYFQHNLKDVHVNVLVSFFNFIILLQPFIIKSALDLAICKPVEDSREWLIADMRVQCWEDTHLKFMLSLALPSFIVWGIALPLAIFAYQINPKNASTASVFFKFLGLGLKPGYSWWFLIELIEKDLLMLCVSVVGIESRKTEMMTGLLVLMISLSFELVKFPSLNIFIHTFNNFIRLTVFVLLSAAFVLYNTTAEKETTLLFIEICLIVTIAFALMAVGVLMCMLSRKEFIKDFKYSRSSIKYKVAPASTTALMVKSSTLFAPHNSFDITSN